MRNRYGFTLIEMIVAIVVIAIILIISISAFNNQNTAVNGQLTTIATAMNEYYKTNGTYPIANFSTFLQDVTYFAKPFQGSDFGVQDLGSSIKVYYAKNPSLQYIFKKSQMGVNP